MKHPKLEDCECIYDCAGNYRVPGFWCDYHQETKTLYFGGAWNVLSPVFWPHVPTEQEVEDYTKRVTRKICDIP